jgi:excisionase family DNA binding protein
MELELKNEFKELKALTLLSAKKVLTMNDASLLTGLSKSHLYKLTCRKEIPHFKMSGGKIICFNREEIEEWQLRHRVKTVDELKAEAATYVLTGNHVKKGGQNV